MAKNKAGKMTPNLRKRYKDALNKKLKDVGISTHDIKGMSTEEFMERTGFSYSYNYLSRGFSSKGQDPSDEAIEDTCKILGIDYTPMEVKPYDVK